MNLTPLSTIQISPNRQRREFDENALRELVESIQSTKAGLLHAPILRAEGASLILVAGERRLRALQDIYAMGGEISYSGVRLPTGMVPYTLLGDLSPLEAWEAELEENIRRVDLSWAEKAQATTSLMALRQAQAAERGDPPATVADLAIEVRGSAVGDPRDLTRKELIVSRHLGDPDVAAAPTLKEAFKVLKRKEEGRQNAALAATIGKTFSSRQHELVNGDCLDWLTTYSGPLFEIILSDPPYGMGADQFGDSGVGTSTHLYEDSYEAWQAIMRVLPSLLYGAAAPAAHCYLFCDLDRFAELRLGMSEAGWKVHRTPIVWYNPDGFRAPWPDQGPQRKYELILYAVKGDRKVNHLAGDVLTYKRDAALGHPAQKPVELLRDLLRRSARPGDRVLDPFGGTGSTVEAAHTLKLACTMLEKDAASYGIAVKRVGALAELEKELL